MKKVNKTITHYETIEVTEQIGVRLYSNNDFVCDVFFYSETMRLSDFAYMSDTDEKNIISQVHSKEKIALKTPIEVTVNQIEGDNNTSYNIFFNWFQKSVNDSIKRVCPSMEANH